MSEKKLIGHHRSCQFVYAALCIMESTSVLDPVQAPSIESSMQEC